MLKYRAAALLFVLPSLMPGQTRAATATASEQKAIDAGAMVIDAQRLENYIDRKMHAIGDAEMRQDDKAIFGDRIDYNELTKELHAIGNTRIEQNGLVVTGPELRLRLDERVGEMKEAVYTYHRPPDKQPNAQASAYPRGYGVAPKRSSPFNRQQSGMVYDESGAPAVAIGQNQSVSMDFARGDAKRIVFEGPDNERLYKARYTTCEAGVNDWFIKANELELDHRAQTGTATNATVEFLSIPILYTPWIDFPFGNQRSSGFLAPNFGTTTKSGAEFMLPYYWNIAPNMDATLAPRYLSKRGMQLQGEFRYLEPTFSGWDQVEYLPNDSQANRDRYYVKLQHNQVFGNGWGGSFNIERASDDTYFSDMSTNIATTSRVNLPQRGVLTYGSDIWSFMGLVENYQTLDKASYTYHRLPQLQLTGQKEWDYVSASLLTQWTQFEISDQLPGSRQMAMASAPSTSLATKVTGSRFVAYPSISLPFTQSFGYVTPKLGVHYTSYNLSNTGYTFFKNGVTTNGDFASDTRALPIFSLDSGLYFDRNMRVVNNTYTQTLEPRLFYVYIPYTNQSKLPVFDTGLADLSMSTLFSENQFTGQDRINDANQLTMAVTSRLIDNKTGVQRLAATIGQRFYFSDRRVGLFGADPVTQNSSDIVAAVNARLRNHWTVDAGWLYNTDTQRTSKGNLTARYNPEPGNVLNLSYRFTRDSLEQIDLSSQWPLGNKWYGLGRWNYSLRENRPIEGLAGLEYDAGCWQARTVMQRVSTATDSKPNYALFFQLELGGMTSIGTSPLTLLRRSIYGYTDTALVPDINDTTY